LRWRILIDSFVVNAYSVTIGKRDVRMGDVVRSVKLKASWMRANRKLSGNCFLELRSANKTLCQFVPNGTSTDLGLGYGYEKRQT